MANRQARKTIGATRVRGENPKRLRPIVSFDRAAALRTLIRVRLGEHSIVNGAANDAVAVRDLTPFSVNDLAADLDGGQPVVNVTLPWAGGWGLRELDLESGSEGSEIGEHGDGRFALQNDVEF